MATVFEIVLPWDTLQADELANALLDEVNQLEAQLTVYRPTSEISRLNRIAAQAPVPLEPKLFELLVECQRLSILTGGAFDITSGPLIKAWGFYHRQGLMPTDDEIARALAVVGMEKIELIHAARSVRFRVPWVEINLGSVGKGYTLDRIAQSFRTRQPTTEALLHAGTSSVLALGAGPSQNGWPVGLKHPTAPRRLGTLRLQNRALGSSGATYQYFEYNGRRLGHLLDPRSGRPAEGMALAAAIAPTATEADALATAFYVLGVEGTRAYCSDRPDVAAVMLPDELGAEPIAINGDELWTAAGPDESYDDVAPSDDA